MFPETLNQRLPQSVADVEKMNLTSRSKRVVNDPIQFNDRSNTEQITRF
jgi:hypothetical protein